MSSVVSAHIPVLDTYTQELQTFLIVLVPGKLGSWGARDDPSSPVLISVTPKPRGMCVREVLVTKMLAVVSSAAGLPAFVAACSRAALCDAESVASGSSVLLPVLLLSVDTEGICVVLVTWRVVALERLDAASG